MPTMRSKTDKSSSPPANSNKLFTAAEAKQIQDAIRAAVGRALKDAFEKVQKDLTDELSQIVAAQKPGGGQEGGEPSDSKKGDG